MLLLSASEEKPFVALVGLWHDAEVETLALLAHKHDSDTVPKMVSSTVPASDLPVA
jgi:hypothetical protein